MELPRVCSLSTLVAPPAQQGLLAVEARVDEPTHEHRLRGCQEEEAAGELGAAPRTPDGMRFWHVIARAAVGRLILISLWGAEAINLGIIVCFNGYCLDLLYCFLQLVMVQCTQARSSVLFRRSMRVSSEVSRTCALQLHGTDGRKDFPASQRSNKVGLAM